MFIYIYTLPPPFFYPFPQSTSVYFMSILTWFKYTQHSPPLSPSQFEVHVTWITLVSLRIQYVAVQCTITDDIWLQRQLFWRFEFIQIIECVLLHITFPIPYMLFLFFPSPSPHIIDHMLIFCWDGRFLGDLDLALGIGSRGLSSLFL